MKITDGYRRGKSPMREWGTRMERKSQMEITDNDVR
jgi:hypothetical protein